MEQNNHPDLEVIDLRIVWARIWNKRSLFQNFSASKEKH